MECIEYISRSLGTVTHPYNGTSVELFKDLPSAATLFEQFLSIEQNKDLNDQITHAIRDHQAQPFGAITERLASLRSLVGAVEPFLKAIGRIRHIGNPQYLADLERAMFKSLLEQGLVIPPTNWDPAYSGRNHDPAYWAAQDIATALAYRVWLLRNEISHEAPTYSSAQLPILFDVVLSFLVNAVQYPLNHVALSLVTSPHYSYLKWAAKNIDLDFERYVPLNAVLTWQPQPGEDTLFTQGREEVTDILSEDVRIGAVIQGVSRCVLTGVGGAGKSRTLQYLAAQLAQDTVSKGGIPLRIPVRFAAYSLVTSVDDVESCISRMVSGTPPQAITSALEEGRYFVFVDALNEVSTQSYPVVVEKLKSFAFRHQRCPLVITTRSESYHNELLLPVYELQPLAPRDVHEILRRYSQTATVGDKLFSHIKNDRRLLALFQTPLMSRLLCELSPHLHIPRSMGEMMASLFEKIFEREQRKGNFPSRILAEIILAQAARVLQTESGKTMPETALLNALSAIARLYDPNQSITRLLDQLIQSGILERASDGRIGFFHETALDFFLAVSYRDVWDESGQKNERMLPPSSAATVILAGLLSSAEDLINVVAQIDIVLSARCYSARSHRSEIYRKLLAQSLDILENGSLTDQAEAIGALAELDEADATRSLYGALAHVSEKLISVAQHILVTVSPSGCSEEALRALATGTDTQKKIALYFVGRTQTAAATPLVLALIGDATPTLAYYIADALGRLDTPDVLACLLEQSAIPANERILPLGAALANLSSVSAVPILLNVIDDADVETRRAAVTRCSIIKSPALLAKLAERLKGDGDFIIRLLAAQAIGFSGTDVDSEQTVRHVFALPLSENLPVPAGTIMAFIAGLPSEVLLETLLQALCINHKGIQSIMVNRILGRASELAIGVFDLIDLSDARFGSAARMALIKAMIQHEGQPLAVARKALHPSVPPSVRCSAVDSIVSHAPSAIPDLLPLVLSDPHPSVRATATKLLASAPELISITVITSLLNDGDQQVSKAARKLLANPGVFSDDFLLGLCGREWQDEIRAASVRVLYHRGAHFPLDLAFEVSLSPNPLMENYGRGILAAIFRDSKDGIGIVKMWTSERGFGFIRPLRSKGDKFFHITQIYDKSYIPQPGDLVSFTVIKGNATDRSTAVDVSLIKSATSVPPVVSNS